MINLPLLFERREIVIVMIEMSEISLWLYLWSMMQGTRFLDMILNFLHYEDCLIDSWNN